MDSTNAAIAPETDEVIRAAVIDFAWKRKAFLAAHAADYKSVETSRTYDASEEAWEDVADMIEYKAAVDPDWLVRAFGADNL